MDLGGIFEKVVNNADKHIKQEPCDYLDDEGLLVCGHCHTRKQRKIELFGNTKTVSCLCKCGTEKREEEKEEIKRQDKEQRIKRLRKMGFPETDMSQCTFEFDDNQNPKVTAMAKKYVDNFKEIKENGSGLILFGNVGSGKTFISACIANELINQGYPCLVTNFSRLTNTISGMNKGRQEYIDGLNKFDLLVIDDLGAERETEYMGEIVHSIIDSRYRVNLPLIITTNLTMQDLTNPKDIRKQRIYSRLLEICVPIQIHGTDKRAQKRKDKYAFMKKILNV